MKRLTVLVTGGAGFIGSALARRLVADGHVAVVVDNLSTGRRDNLLPGVEFVEGDIGDPGTIAQLPDLAFDAVCHLAAQSSGAVSMERPLYDIQTNAVSTVLLVRWCQQRNIQRFLYASSMAVYGNPAAVPVAEDAPLLPVSYYGVSKLASEHVLRVAASGGLAATALRMFNVYGPGQNLANLRQGMASIYLAYLLNGQEVPVTGSLDRFRDFVYIDDVIGVWINVLGRPATPSLVYNIGSGVATTVQHLLQNLIEACGLPADHPVRVQPGPPGDQFGLSANCHRAQGELSWTAQTPLRTGLRTMVDWARAQGHA